MPGKLCIYALLFHQEHMTEIVNIVPLVLVPFSHQRNENTGVPQFAWEIYKSDHIHARLYLKSSVEHAYLNISYKCFTSVLFPFTFVLSSSFTAGFSS